MKRNETKSVKKFESNVESIQRIKTTFTRKRTKNGLDFRTFERSVRSLFSDFCNRLTKYIFWVYFQPLTHLHSTCLQTVVAHLTTKFVVKGCEMNDAHTL